jgi:2-iminobutanoate/2-iminopropanoate deaminase
MTGRLLSISAILAVAAFFSLLSAQSGKQDKSGLPKTDLPFSQTVTSGDMVFVSGQVGIDPSTGKMAGDDIASQTRQALLNIERHLEAAGSDLNQVVKTTVFLKNIQDYADMNAVYKQVLGASRPARATVAVADLVAGAVIEIDAIAVKGKRKGKIEHR